MHYYGEQYKHLYLPGSGCITESIQHCTTQPDTCSTTCHPLSIIKGPVPRWQSYTQPLTYVCPQPSVSQTSLLACQPCVSQSSLLACQPYVQRCVLLYPEPCETTCLLPCRKPSMKLSTMSSFQPCEANCPEKKRLAKSLPPCAPRCPEPTKLKYPPCGIRYSSSCKEECRAQRMAKCSSQRYGSELWSVQGTTGGYSLPLQGVTECPPQQCVTQSFLQEYVSGFPQQKCMRGYPTQECVTSYSSQQCTKCLPEKGIKECSTKQHTAKYSLTQEGTKHKSSTTQHLTKSKCLYSRATHHSSHHHTGGAKRSSHSKKSRCVAKWLW
ncbi:uncharacterized protein LOC127394824 [Apus apus]|uniref:uncharacterized protein LOC127394824 n=1 Tax=Apus apus TaxID=8895 RepID=UPI0021F89802|nr:uncharacterized protein LOC127394824 [Apus apus]